MIALLRGINVGGRNKVPMADLRQLFSSLGHHDVRTLIQSGNVVFEPADDAAKEAELSASLAVAIKTTFDVTSPVVIRTVDEMASAATENPFYKPDRDPAKLHLVFLDRAPTKKRIAALDPDRSPPDEFVVLGRHMYWWFPNGAAKSKLTLDYFERVLGVTGTARNLRTTEKLLGLAAPMLACPPDRDLGPVRNQTRTHHKTDQTRTHHKTVGRITKQ